MQRGKTGNVVKQQVHWKTGGGVAIERVNLERLEGRFQASVESFIVLAQGCSMKPYAELVCRGRRPGFICVLHSIRLFVESRLQTLWHNSCFESHSIEQVELINVP